MTIILTKSIRVAGAPVAAGTTVTYSADLEADLVQRGHATYAAGSPSFPGREVPVMVSTSSSGGIGKMQAGDATRYFTEVIYSLAADSVGSAGTTPQQLAAVRLPAGGLSVGSLIRLTIAESKSGTSETMTGGIYIGPNGNNTDQLITSAPTLVGTAVAQGGIFGIEITSNTTARGAGALDAKGNMLGTSTSAFADKTIGDIRSVDNWISIYTTMSGSVEVPTLRILTVEVVPGTV